MPPKEAVDATGVVEVDTMSSDATSSDLESVYASDDTASVTTSLMTFVKEYKEEYGRRYHAFEREKWIVPNDEAQQNQMDLFHAVYSKAMAISVGATKEDPKAEKGFLAPIGDKPQRVLDLGTGTGIWAIQFADAHPSAEVIGTDISPIQPVWVPPNLRFEIDDFNDTWTFKKGSFDFIYARGLHGACSDWPKLLKQAYDILKPGGWLEICDEGPEVLSDDGTMNPKTSPCYKWMENGRKVLDMIGRTGTHYNHLPQWLPEAGFTEFEHKYMKLPVGIWPKDKLLKELGGMMLVGMLAGAEGWTLDAYTKVLQKPELEARECIADTAKEMKNRKVHIYMPMHVFYAQKPTVDAAA